MNKLIINLKNIGLTGTEAKIYLTGLGYAGISVNELTKQTNINRTTIYHALGTLTEKGLVAKKGTGVKQVFTMTKPENITNLINEKINTLKKQKDEITEVLPLLQQIHETSETKMNVSHYEGIEGIKLVIEDALYCKNRHWDMIAPIKNFFSEFNQNYAKYFITTRGERQITSRSLWEKKEDQQNMTPKQLQERNPRILPSIMHGRFKSVICLYDDKVLIISSLKELSAILIQSQELHNTITTIFDGLWSASKEIKLKSK